MQFHFRTFAEFLLLSAYLLTAFAVIGAPVKVLLRALGVRVARTVPAPTIGIALIVLASWYWAQPFGATKPLGRALLGIGAIVVLAVTGWAVVRRTPARAFVNEHRTRHAAYLGAICFMGVATIFVVNDTQLFMREHFTVLSLGNNDAPSYALEAQHLLDEGPDDPGNIAAYHAGVRSLGFSNGAYTTLAAAASVTDQDVWRVMQATIFAVVVLAAYTLALLLREALGSAYVIVAGVAATVGFAVLYVAYLIAQWFFAQLVGMCIVLAVAALLFRAVRMPSRRDHVAAAMLVGLLVAAGLSIYPHMVVVGSVTLLPVVAVTSKSFGALLRRGVRTALVFAGGLAVAAVIAPGLVFDAIDITRELEDVEAGWPLPSIFPTEMLGFQTSATAGQGWLTVAASVVVIAALLALAIVAWRRGLGSRALPLVAGLAAVLITYALVYRREGGPTYRQWKWVTFFVPVFVACAVALVALAASTALRHRDFWRRTAYVGLGAHATVALLFSAGAGFQMSLPQATYLSVTLDEVNLRYNEQVNALPSLHINTSPYWETMWLAYFLRAVPVTLGPPSYYPVSAPAGRWFLERNDQPLAPGATATPLNATYRLVQMP